MRNRKYIKPSKIFGNGKAGIKIAKVLANININVQKTNLLKMNLKNHEKALKENVFYKNKMASFQFTV